MPGSGVGGVDVGAVGGSEEGAGDVGVVEKVGLGGSGGSATGGSPAVQAVSARMSEAATQLDPVIQAVLPVPSQHRWYVAGQRLAQQAELAVVEVERREATRDVPGRTPVRDPPSGVRPAG